MKTIEQLAAEAGFTVDTQGSIEWDHSGLESVSTHVPCTAPFYLHIDHAAYNPMYHHGPPERAVTHEMMQRFAALVAAECATLAHNKALHCEEHDNPYGQGAALDIDDAIRAAFPMPKG